MHFLLLLMAFANAFAIFIFSIRYFKRTQREKDGIETNLYNADSAA